MGILDSIVGWIAEQIMNLLDLVTGSVLGALGCDMSVFIRYFPAAETMYEVFVAIAVGFILLNLVWQLFKNYGAGIGLSAEDPGKLLLRSLLFLFLALFSDQIMTLVLDIAGTPYSWDCGCVASPNRVRRLFQRSDCHCGLSGVRIGQSDCTDPDHHRSMELHQTPFRGSRAVHHGWRACLYRANGLCHRSLGEHGQHLQRLGQDDGRPTVPTHHERMVSSPFCFHGG